MKTRRTSQMVTELRLEDRRCPLCGQGRAKQLFSDINRRQGLPISGTVVECQQCAMRYVDPAPNTAGLAEIYRRGYIDPVTAKDPQTETQTECQAGNGKGSRAIYHALNGALRGHPHDWPEEESRGRSILDFGCHSGGKLVRWYLSGWSVAGVDLNQEAIASARRRFPKGKFWCGDLLHLDIADRFDFIRSDNVIEHLLNPLAYLEALRDLLKPGGKLRVIVPNVHGLSATVFGRFSYVYWMPFHVNLFSAKTLQAALRAAGFTKVECFPFAPVGSWVHTQRQLFLRPGFDRRPPGIMDRALRALSPASYPGELLAHWLRLGDELIATGTNAVSKPFHLHHAATKASPGTHEFLNPTTGAWH